MSDLLRDGREHLARRHPAGDQRGDLVSMRLPEAAGLAAMQDRIGDIVAAIIRRAQEQGSLRPDLTREDLVFVIWSQSRINQATRDVAPRARRRHLYLLLDGFRAEHAHHPCRSR